MSEFDKTPLYSVEINNKKLFSVNQIIITDEKNNTYSDSSNDIDVSLEFYEEKNLVAINFNSVIKPQKPFFGPQVYFATDECIKINLATRINSPMLTLYQHKHWWIRPSFPKSMEDINDRTQLLMWKDKGKYVVFITTSGNQGRSDIKGTTDGISLSYSTNTIGLKECSDLLGVITCGDNPFECINRATKKALELTGKEFKMRNETKFPKLFDYLGWCTWDAFYHDVSESKILSKLEEFKSENIPIRWVLIDDGWSNADYESQKLIGFDCDKIKFPEGLKSTVGKIREYENIIDVGVWQACMGYWNGIESGSEVFIEQEKNLYSLPDGRVVVMPLKENVFSFWNSWHSYLKEAGISFVKVDGQSAIRHFHKEASLALVAKEWHKGIEMSVQKNFDGNIINCMGMASENFWNRSFSSLSRSSDDFMPEKENGFIEHALQNGYNSLLHNQLYWPDWDMFWSKHVEAKQNAILRAISGGPIYISDAIGKTDTEVIKPLILNNGEILRCDKVAIPTLDCLLDDPQTSNNPFKLYNKVEDNYVIAAINLNSKHDTVTGNICSSNIPELFGKDFYIYDFNNKKFNYLSEGEVKEITLTKGSANVYLLIPTQSNFAHEYCIVLGLIDKYISTKTIKDLKVLENEVCLTLKQGGKFGFICKEKQIIVTVNGQRADINRDGTLCIVDINEPGQSEIRIKREI